MENTSVRFTDDALKGIAQKAMKRDVGARALRAIVEELMLNIMYELPEHKEEGAEYEITAEMVDGAAKPTLFAARRIKKEIA